MAQAGCREGANVIENIQLETGVILVFLAMVVQTEFGRAMEPDYDVLGGRAPLRLLPYFFVCLVAGFAAVMRGVPPLLGFELAAGITLSLLHPANAVCFIVHLMILRPWEAGPPNPVLALIPKFGVFLCVISWLIHPSRHARLSRRNHRGVLLLTAFSGWLLLTAVKSPSITLTITDWFDKYFKVLMLFATALLLIDSERSVRELQLTLAISGLSVMAAGINQYLTTGLTEGRLVSTGMLGDPNDMGALIVMALPFALVPAFEKESGAFSKMAGLLYAALAAFVIWMTRSRGTMLAVVAQLIVFRLLRSKRTRLTLLLSAGLFAGAYSGLMLLVPRDAGEMEASQDSRLTFWKSAVNMAVHNPLLGVGFDQYGDNYMDYAVGTVIERGNRTAHSSWFLALGESGFIGFYLFCAFFISVVRIAWNDRVKRPAQLYAVAGYGVAMSFLSHTYSLYFYILMALALASAGVMERVKNEA